MVPCVVETAMDETQAKSGVDLPCELAPTSKYPRFDLAIGGTKGANLKNPRCPREPQPPTWPRPTPPTVPHHTENQGFGIFWDRQIVWSFISSDNENDRRRKRAREGD